MQDAELIQGSNEWRLARCGSLGASQVALALAKGKGASRENVMAALILERLTGNPTETFINAAMREGTEQEPNARAAYAFERDVDVVMVGLVRHPALPGTHASPDGLVGEDGQIQIKCPQPATHLDSLLGGSIDGKYIKQMQWEMRCTGRQWCDFVSYNEMFPHEMRLHIERVHRDDKMLAEMDKEIAEFLATLGGRLAQLRQRFPTTEPELETVAAG